MKVALLDVIQKDGKTVHLSVGFEQKEILLSGNTYPVLSCSPVSLEIENVGHKVLEVRGSAEVTVSMPCDRCLKEVAVKLPLDFGYRFDMKLSEEELAKEQDVVCIEGTELDVDALIYAETLMALPFKVLCRPGCKGLCSQCGKDLNEGPCGCDEQPKDPRMAAISDIFKKSLQGTD